MKNYRIHFNNIESERVLNFLSRFNDVVINQVEPESVFITIQLEDDEADAFHADLRSQIDSGIQVPYVNVKKENTIEDDNIAVV